MGKPKKKAATPRSSSLDLRCSFCGKPHGEVRKLIAGPTVHICNECIWLCLDVLAHESPRVLVPESSQVLARLPDGTVRGLGAITDWYRSGGDVNVFEWCCADDAEGHRWVCCRRFGSVEVVVASALAKGSETTRDATMATAAQLAETFMPRITRSVAPLTWVACEEVLYCHADGPRIAGRIAIGLPYVADDVEARCRVVLDGIRIDSTISGASTLQALLLAIRFAGSMLQHFLDGGGKVLGAEGEDIALDAIFGGLLSRP